jgi:60 kDa SS-A/Ro ribonucleoprotein
LTPRDAAAAMATVTVRTEPFTLVKAFSDKLLNVAIGNTTTFRQAVDLTSQFGWGGTNPGLLFEHAIDKKLEIDHFVVYTDNEVNNGKNVFQLLTKYRKLSGIEAKLTVVGFTATEFTLNDPLDGGSLAVVGFDSAAPAVIADFARV